jgi:DNA-binding MarR family transcriptional regulator
MVDEYPDDTGTAHGTVPHLLAGLEAIQRRLGHELRRRFAGGHLVLRGSEGRILDLIEPAGSRPTALADGAWISKQAIGKRIQDLEARGLVRVGPDPSDGRAVLVHRTGEGERARASIRAQIRDLEEDLSAQVGPERYRVFREVLDELAGSAAPTGPRLMAGAGAGAPVARR